MDAPGASDARAGSCAELRLQFAVSGSLTTTFVSTVLPVFVTVMVNRAVPPAAIDCAFGFLTIVIPGAGSGVTVSGSHAAVRAGELASPRDSTWYDVFPTGAKSSETAVGGVPGVSATVWFVVAPPVQSLDGKRWKMTFPVGFGTPAGVPSSRSTNTLSCTTVPATTVVTTAPDGFRMSVLAVASPQSFAASALSPVLASALARCKVTPLTTMSVLALVVVVPTVEETMTTLQEPLPPVV